MLGCTLVTGARPAAAEALAYGSPALLCTVTDPSLAELSGLVGDGESLFAVADGGQSLRVAVLDRRCAVTAQITAPVDPYDIEDLAMAADGALWLADTGDNSGSRDTAALHRLTRDGRAQLFRLTYPDGPHDAEALLLDRSGQPYVVTKNPLGDAGVYAPDGVLRDGRTTPLRLEAVLQFAPTGTPGGPVGVFGQLAVTGGAVSADGTLVVLRTYTDAYVYPAPDGDVAAALTRPPIQIALPPQPQGEAVAVDTDGASLLLAGEGLPTPVVRLPAMRPAASSTPASSGPDAVSADAPRAPTSDRGRWWWALPLAGAAVLGVAVGLVRRRVRRQTVATPPGWRTG